MSNITTTEHSENYILDWPPSNEESADFPYWDILGYAALASVAFFLILSVFFNLANITTVAGHGSLRPCGYYHILAIFSVFNVIYFVLQFLILALEYLSPFDLPDFIPDDFLQDLALCLVGLQILLLCVMTLEHRLNLSRHFYFKPRGQTCMRVFMTFLAFAAVVGCLVVSTLIRSTDLIFDQDEDDESIFPVLIIYSTFLMVFTCLPSFIIVIVGVINCVSSWNSNRYHPIETRLAQKLDLRFGLFGFILMIATVFHLILELAVKINAYQTETLAVLLSDYAVKRFIDILLIILPLSITCVFGKRCCCWCCCKPCQPPMDE